MVVILLIRHCCRSTYSRWHQRVYKQASDEITTQHRQESLPIRFLFHKLSFIARSAISITLVVIYSGAAANTATPTPPIQRFRRRFDSGTVIGAGLHQHSSLDYTHTNCNVRSLHSLIFRLVSATLSTSYIIVISLFIFVLVSHTVHGLGQGLHLSVILNYNTTVLISDTVLYFL